MDIQFKTAGEDLHCSRCRELGIPDKTILRGQLYSCLSNDHKTDNCCADCYDRLYEESAVQQPETYNLIDISVPTWVAVCVMIIIMSAVAMMYYNMLK